MKLLLDTNKFYANEYEALTLSLKEKEALVKFINDIKSGEEKAPEDDFTISYKPSYKNEYIYFFGKDDRELILHLLERLLIQLDKSIEDIIDHLGLERIEE